MRQDAGILIIAQLLLKAGDMHLTEKVTEIQADVSRASGEHFRLVWVAGGTALERSALLRVLAEVEDGALIDVGKKLSTALIEIPVPLRTASVAECFAACMGESPSAVTCLDHLEILFEPSLRLNPVSLVQGASRRNVLVAAWPGLAETGRLTFGSIDHPAHMDISEQEIESIVHHL